MIDGYYGSLDGRLRYITLSIAVWFAVIVYYIYIADFWLTSKYLKLLFVLFEIFLRCFVQCRYDYAADYLQILQIRWFECNSTTPKKKIRTHFFRTKFSDKFFRTTFFGCILSKQCSDLRVFDECSECSRVTQANTKTGSNCPHRPTQPATISVHTALCICTWSASTLQLLISLWCSQANCICGNDARSLLVIKHKTPR